MMNKMYTTTRHSLFIFVLLSLLVAQAGFAQTGEEAWLAFFKHNDVDKALATFAQAVQKNSEDALAYAGFGLIGLSRVQETDALESLLDALEEGYTRPEAALYLYEAMRMLSGRSGYEIAERRINALLKHDDIPDHLRSDLLFNQARLLQRLGQWEKAKNAFNELSFLTRFWICGPFDNAEKRGHIRVYGPEENLDLNATYKGRRGTVQWRPLPLNPDNGYIDAHALVDPSNESTVYLAASIQSEEQQRCSLSFGHAGALKAWLNGQLIADMDRYHSLLPDQVNTDTKLSSGTNTLLIKLSSGEKGKFGEYVRFVPDQPEMVKVVSPLETDQLPDLSAHTPNQQQEAPPTLKLEPVPIRQLKALGEGPGAKPYHHLFYALLLQRLDIADENDNSANTMLTKLSRLYPGNPYLIRQVGESEKQENLRRLAYTKALEIDPGDRVSFLLLLDYYRNAPYATKGLEFIRQWEDDHELPAEALIIQAQLWNGKGLREAAVDQIRSVSADSGDKGKWRLYSIAKSMTSPQEQKNLLKEILHEKANHMKAVNELRSLALREGDIDSLNHLHEIERNIDPFSVSGLMDRIHYKQAENDYSGSLKLLEHVLEISPDHHEAHRLSAVAQHMLGDDKAALSELEAALVSRPSDPWCQEYKELLQPEEDNYATPYLKDWKTIEIPETFDLSKANYVVLLDQRVVKVHQNGNASETVRQVVEVLTDTGVRMQSVGKVYYDAGLSEEIRIVHARVWKQDGTYYDAPAAERRSAASASNAYNRLYEDYYVATIRFPALEKGSIIEFEYKKEQKGENIYADYFGDLFFAGDTNYEPTIHSDYVLITPKTRNFYWKFIDAHYPDSTDPESIELIKKPEITDSENEKVYHWSCSYLPTIPREPYMPYASEVLPYIKVSTFKTWNDMTDWYWNLIKDQLIPGPVLNNKVKEVVQNYRQEHGLTEEDELDQMDLVRAINSFVNTEVRYLGLEFGIHGYKPHKVDEICNAQYGDCKDKAVLAISMLGELGIDAYVVIIRTTNKGEIDYELPSLGIFNHAIYYLPDLNGKEYWIDGTATFHDATELPSMDTGANTLIIKPGGEYMFKRIPIPDAEENGSAYTTVLNLDEQGNAQGIFQGEFEGVFNPAVRRTYENPAKAKEIIDRTLSVRYPGSQSMNVELSNLDDYATPEHISYELEIPQFASKQGSQWVMPLTLFDERMSSRYAHLSSREFDLVLSTPWMKKNNLTINVPEEFNKVVLPPNRQIENEFGSYVRSIKQDENKIIIKEKLVFEQVRIPKENYQDFREFCRLVDHYQDEKLQMN